MPRDGRAPVAPPTHWMLQPEQSDNVNAARFKFRQRLLQRQRVSITQWLFLLAVVTTALSVLLKAADIAMAMGQALNTKITKSCHVRYWCNSDRCNCKHRNTPYYITSVKPPKYTHPSIFMNCVVLFGYILFVLHQNNIDGGRHATPFDSDKHFVLVRRMCIKNNT